MVPTSSDGRYGRATVSRNLAKAAPATRHFLNRPIDRALIEEIVDVARLTGSARNRQPWRFVVVEDQQTRGDLSRLGAYAGHVAMAPVVLLICSQPSTGGLDRLFDLGRAAQALVTAAAEVGLGTCLATLYPDDNQRRAAALVGLAENWVASHAISVGLPGEPEAQLRGSYAIPRGRLSLDEVLTWYAPSATQGIDGSFSTHGQC